MEKSLDNENRQAVAPFHYGPVAGLVSLFPGTSGMAARQWRAEAERDPVFAGTTSTRIGVEAIRHGFYGDRARRMPPEIAELPIPVREENSTVCVRAVINAARKRDLPPERNVLHYYVWRGLDDERQPLWFALLLEPPALRDRDANETDCGYRTRGLYARPFGAQYRSLRRGWLLVLRHAADLPEQHNCVLSRAFRFLGVDPDVRVPPARVLAGSPRRRLAKAPVWLCCLAEVASLRGLGVRR